MIFITKTQIMEHTADKHMFLTKRIVKIANKFIYKLNLCKGYFNRYLIPRIYDGFDFTGDINKNIMDVTKMIKIINTLLNRKTPCKFVYKDLIENNIGYVGSHYDCYINAFVMIYVMKCELNVVLDLLKQTLDFIKEYKEQIRMRDNIYCNTLAQHIHTINNKIYDVSKWVSIKSEIIKHDKEFYNTRPKIRQWLRLNEIFTKKINKCGSDSIDYLDKNVIFREIINFMCYTKFNNKFIRPI